MQDTLAKARVEQGLPVAPKSAERSRRSHVHYAHQNGGAAAADDDDECAADETVEHAKRAFLQHVREETGVQLTASRWRVEFEAANTSSASKRKRFFAPDGRKLGEVATPEAAANLAWGGDDWRTLFFTARTSVYAVRTRIGPHAEPFMRAG